MNVQQIIPERQLRQYVHKFLHIHYDFPIFSFKVIPRNYPAIIFMGDGAGKWEIQIGVSHFPLKKKQVYFAGLGNLPSTMSFEGTLKAWVVMLQPHVFGSIVKDFPCFLINKITADSIAMQDWQQLNEQLWQAETFFNSHKILESFFHSFFENTIYSPYLFKAFKEIQASKGRLNIHEIACKSNTSTRNLLREFIQYSGLTPKKYASMIRFSALVDDFIKSPDIKLNDLVAKYNYYDLPHLNKCAREFLGSSLSSKNPFVKGLNEPLS